MSKLQVTDMLTWLLDNSERIFRYQVYRRLFTPFEQQQAYRDESQFESTYYSFGMIEETIDLGNGEWLIGIREIVDGEVTETVGFHKLSDIKLSLMECDQKMLSEEEDEE